MKCQYCGGNLQLDNEVCPFCGRENTKAKKYIDTKKGYQKEFDETEKKVQKKVKLNARTGRLLVIALMVLIIAVFVGINRWYDDAENRIHYRQEKTKQLAEKNIQHITETLQEMEKNREYLGISNLYLNYLLSRRDDLQEYGRVFSAANSYESVFEYIVNIATGFGYNGETSEYRCGNIAHSVTNWNWYVSGEARGVSDNDPRLAGEHGAFVADCKVAVGDMVQVYFKLTDEETAAMWTMEQTELAALLYERYQSYYPEVSANE
ncbi:MAG: hypothetical protein MJ114_06380 [Acetatifactor sp.]|nr:hypothetical protein [Acetatifactor sp.]